MTIDVELDGFSGPLDLLCHLVETGEIQASEISVSELIHVYSDFLLINKRAGINEMAAFFSLTARLLLGKLKALLPSLPGFEPPPGEEFADPDLLMEVLSRYRPYRNAALHLTRLLKLRERSFMRTNIEEGPPWYDLGDLYSLSMVWWEMLGRRREKTDRIALKDEEQEWNGIPVATPDEDNVENRMDELRGLICRRESMLLSEIIGYSGTRQTLVVTLLALLEMTRLGIIHISQEEPFGDVRIRN
ncbi:MAG: ScpA family protein [Thermovirga sp.]